MKGAVPDILARIVEHKRAEVASLTPQRDRLEAAAETQLAARRDFAAALRARDTAVIAEFKRASPSRGVFAGGADAAAAARAYESGGAACLSVLTDQEFFAGGFADLAAARAAVPLPVLRKDFLIDDAQVMEAAAAGADAVLLIAAILTREQMERMRLLAARFGMAALVEVHNEVELSATLDSGATLIGVNNRDLRTFAVSLETGVRLAARMPAGVLKVAESGIHSAADLRFLKSAGFDAFLVGEHLMTATEPAAALRALMD